MKSKILLFGAVALQVWSMSVRSADLFGNWIARAGSGAGFGETVFSFRVDGAKLTGAVSDFQGKTDIRDGRIDGDEISFHIIRGYGGNERKLMYKGKVGLNEIRFTLEEQGGTGQPREFVAKREFQRNQDIPLRSDPVKVSPPE